MDKLSMFSSDSAAMSCLVMYRMGGLRHVLLYLHDMLRQFLPVVRINSLFCTPDGATIISMSDTSTVNVSNKYSVAGKLPPMVDREHITDDIVLRDLRPYQKPEMLKDERNADVPYLQHRALMRLPLFRTGNAIFVFNFWADESDAFDEEDLAGLRRLLGPLAEELRGNLSGIKLHGAPPASVTGLSGKEKICLCPGLAGVRRMAEQVARVDSTVLIMGETGVGKEAVADMVHELSARKDGPLVKVNCGAIPESLLDSELFGHEKGAFTGAQASRPGYFEMAEGGTLFLDEIGEMSLSAQVRLLRVLDGGLLRRVGGTKFFPVDVRVIAATHDDLPRKVVDGRFRKDLWFRLSVFPIEIPPLIRRKGDITPLVAHFIRTKSRKMGLPFVPQVEERDLHSLYHYEWPGNVRELEHVVERALLENSTGDAGERLRFTIRPLPGKMTPAPEESTKNAAAPKERDWPTLRDWEDRYIRDVLEHCGGKLTGADSATAILDIHYSTLRTRMRKLGIPMPGEKVHEQGAQE